MRDALLVLNETLPDLRRAGGPREQVDPVRHLIGTASVWGLNPDKDAIYLNVTPAQNDGTASTGWMFRRMSRSMASGRSLSTTPTGHFQKNDLDAYSLNNITREEGRGRIGPFQFGGCDGTIPNCLPTMHGWNYMVRLYRPRPEILNGTWTFPQAQPVD